MMRPFPLPRRRRAIELGDSPLTDVRALGSSTLFHAAVVLLAWITVLNVALPLGGEQSRPRALYAELDPVDNRESIPFSPGEGGGSPGEVGGTSSVPFISTSEGPKPQQATRDSVADNLLAEILPDPQPKPAESAQRALPGPQTTGEGILPGSGSGGGEGAGGGSGGGAGRSIGPGTQFFGAREHAHSFTYVIDCSGSMATRNSLDVAKREMMASINQLAPDAEFGVIFYNLQTRVLNDPKGNKGLMAATALNKSRVQSQLEAVSPLGGTDHMLALREAFKLKSEVIFFLTDAELISNTDIDEILPEVGRTRIQVVEFGVGMSLGQRTPLHRLAANTGGTYRYIDVGTFGK